MSGVVEDVSLGCLFAFSVVAWAYVLWGSVGGFEVMFTIVGLT